MEFWMIKKSAFKILVHKKGNTSIKSITELFSDFSKLWFWTTFLFTSPFPERTDGLGTSVHPVPKGEGDDWLPRHRDCLRVALRSVRGAMPPPHQWTHMRAP